MKIIRILSGTTAALAVVAAGLFAAPAEATVSRATLNQAKLQLDATLTVPGTAFAVDPASRKVVVSADSTVTGAKLRTVESAVRSLNGAARLQKISGTLSTRIAGGDAIYAAGYVCSLGFNVRSGSTYYFLTAGHCGNLSTTWYSNSAQTTAIGTRTGTSFPSNDYAIVRYTGSTAHPGSVDLYNGSTQDITRSANATVGQSVKRSGRTTHVHSGTVTALNATVNYAEGRVTGLIQTTVCAEGGDSGGPLFAGTTALGLTSGGSGNCTVGGTTFFQPVTEVLSRYGVSVY